MIAILRIYRGTNGIRGEKMRDINLYAYRLRHQVKLKAQPEESNETPCARCSRRYFVYIFPNFRFSQLRFSRTIIKYKEREKMQYLRTLLTFKFVTDRLQIKFPKRVSVSKLIGKLKPKVWLGVRRIFRP